MEDIFITHGCGHMEMNPEDPEAQAFCPCCLEDIEKGVDDVVTAIEDISSKQFHIWTEDGYTPVEGKVPLGTPQTPAVSGQYPLPISGLFLDLGGEDVTVK